MHTNKKDIMDYKEMLHVQPITVIVPVSLFEDHSFSMKSCIIYISSKELCSSRCHERTAVGKTEMSSGWDLHG